MQQGCYRLTASPLTGIHKQAAHFHVQSVITRSIIKGTLAGFLLFLYLFKALDNCIVAALAVAFIKPAALIAYAIPAFGAGLGYGFITGTSADRTCYLRHPENHLSVIFLYIFPKVDFIIH